MVAQEQEEIARTPRPSACVCVRACACVRVCARASGWRWRPSALHRTVCCSSLGFGPCGRGPVALA
eukprot:4665918-Alexandrium_andersonii.AAC.1